jgi:hypothetical protein
MQVHSKTIVLFCTGVKLGLLRQAKNAVVSTWEEDVVENI